MRYDLAFFLCCCKSFLGNDDPQDDYYTLLGIDRDATTDEIKRGYKRQSLAMHPDKLAQRGQTVTPESQAKFTKMKEAYEILNDPHKRQTYDALGAKAMKWVDEPFSADPQELAHNFAKSSVLDRSKIFAIFVVLAIAILILPLLICLRVDGLLGDASWLATFTPLWIWDGFLIFYHCRVIAMGPIPRPEHIPEDDWVDPLPMQKRYFSMLRFTLIVLFEVLVALRLDHVFTGVPWFVIFIPLYIWEATTLYKKLPLARMRIVTVEDLEAALGKPFSEFTQSEKDLIGKRYSVVSSSSGPDFEAAQKLKVRARFDIAKSGFRIVFCLILILQLHGGNDWNWWLVFTPFWLMVFGVCYSQYASFLEVQRMAKEKDPAMFGGTYGATEPQAPTLSEQEREELRAHVAANSSKLCSKCCSQGFLLILLCLFVAKLQGAGFSSLWIISPFLALASLVLCCIGGAIFGVTEVPTDGINFEDNVYVNAEEGTGPHVPMQPQKPVQEATPVIIVPAQSVEQPDDTARTESVSELD